jgi:hypothetical protein
MSEKIFFPLSIKSKRNRCLQRLLILDTLAALLLYFPSSLSVLFYFLLIFPE